MALILIAGVIKYSEHALSAPAESAQHHAQHSHCTNLCRSVEHASHTVYALLQMFVLLLKLQKFKSFPENPL